MSFIPIICSEQGQAKAYEQAKISKRPCPNGTELLSLVHIEFI